MHYVYRLQSLAEPDRFYIGSTADLKARIEAHNAGRSPHTAKHKPWQLHSYHAFLNKETALQFETYLKTGSGRAFANRHLS